MKPFPLIFQFPYFFSRILSKLQRKKIKNTFSNVPAWSNMLSGKALQLKIGMSSKKAVNGQKKQKYTHDSQTNRVFGSLSVSNSCT